MEGSPSPSGGSATLLPGGGGFGGSSPRPGGFGSGLLPSEPLSADVRLTGMDTGLHAVELQHSGALAGGSASGFSTPGGARPGMGTVRALSGTRTQVQGAGGVRANYESALMQTMRRQMAEFEDRVSRQVNKMESQLSGGTGQGVLARLEDKVSAAEASVPKLDRRVAEVHGTVKGLSEEMQSQIRKINGVEEWVFSAHQQLQTDLRAKMAELEQQVQKVSSAVRITEVNTEESQKRFSSRLARLENDVDNRLSSQEDGGFASVFARLEALEDRSLTEEAQRFALAAPLSGARSHAGHHHTEHFESAQMSMVEKRLEDLGSTTDRVFQDMHEVHTRMAEQRVELGTLRTLLDTREDHLKQLGDRMEKASSWESKMQAFQQAVQEGATRAIGQQERLELLLRRVEHQESQADELREAHERLAQAHRGMQAMINQNGDADEGEGFAGGRAALEEIRSIMRLTEDRVNDLTYEMSTTRDELSVVPQITALVVQLKDMVPRVVDHDRRIRELAEQSTEEQEKHAAAVSQQVGALETQVQELSKSFVSSLEQVKDTVQMQLDAQREASLEASAAAAAAAAAATAAGGAERRGVDEARLQELQGATTAELKALRELLEERSQSAVASAEGAAAQASEASSKAVAAEAKAGEVQGRLCEMEEKEEEARRRLSEGFEERLARADEDLDASKAATRACSDSVSVLRSEVDELRGTAAAASEKAAEENVRIEIDDLRSQINTCVADAANQQQARFEQDFEVATGLLREGLARVAEQSESTLRMVKGTVVDLQLLHTDFDDIRASRAGGGASEDLEVLRRTIEAVKQKQGDLDDSLGIVKTDLESMKTSAVAEDVAALKSSVDELQRRGGSDADLDGLRRQVAELQVAETLGVALEELRAELAELKARSGALCEVETLKTELAELKGRSGVASDIDLLKSEIAELMGRSGVAGDVDVLKSEVAELKGRCGTREELAAVRGEIVELEGRCGAAADVQGLRGEVAELRRRSEATVAVAETARGEPAAPSADEGALRSEICAVASRLGEQQELARKMQAEVVALSAKLECLAVSTSGGGGYDSADAFPEFALAAKEDEAAEAGAQRRLLSRIDELVDRLAEVADIGVGEGVGAVGGLDPEFRRQFEGLVGQVEAMSATELQIQAKFDGFVAQFTQQSPKGRGAAAAVGTE
mmetsp:Transcript_15355/g.49323  ORF Transcript_15355/g.49323 Transcript_15355/m.49323 type:complete len:1176 (+) Transcript_15355:161-3688(+)